eukprot:TRINITY_DN7639_c0_g1_i1.p1 TRINITY_DN7639_c0_g1~~TRINITY_DN7639_c0_g1_i1.p1  ORF type:complete len:1155 (+),score=303.46 TRINITY_DN7639_c0_g1_i1:41-3466(+)
MTGKKRRKGQGGGGGGAELGARAQKLLKEAAELYERRAKGNTKSTLKAAWRAAEDFVDTAGQLQGVSTQDVKLLRQRLADVHAERVQGAPDDDKDDGAKLRTGDWVKAHSLAENHLNGERGHLASFDQEKGRWEVHFPFATGGAVTCRIRERNLSKDTERSSKDHVDQAWRLFRRGQYEVAEGCCHQALQLAWTFEEQTNAAHCLCAVTHAEAQRHAISDWGHDRELELVAMRALQLLRTSASFRSALPDVANPSTIVPFLRKMRAAASAFGLEAAAPHLGYRWVALEAPSPLQAPGSRLATLRAEQTASPNGFANCRPMRQAEILVLCLQVLTRPFLDDAQSALLCRGVDEKLAELVAAAKPNTDVSDLRAADFAACGASVEDTVEALRRIAQTPPPTVPGYDCRMTTADNPTMTVGEEWVLPLFLVGKTEAPFVELQAQNFAGYLMESALHRPQHHPLRRPLKIALGGEQKRAAARLAAARSARPEDAAALVNSAFANIDDGTPVRQLQEVMQGAGVPDDSLQDAVVRLRRISAVEPGSMKGRSQRRSLDWVALPDHRLVLSARKAETLHFEGICEKALRCEKPQRTIRKANQQYVSLGVAPEELSHEQREADYDMSGVLPAVDLTGSALVQLHLQETVEEQSGAYGFPDCDGCREVRTGARVVVVEGERKEMAKPRRRELVQGCSGRVSSCYAAGVSGHTTGWANVLQDPAEQLVVLRRRVGLPDSPCWHGMIVEDCCIADLLPGGPGDEMGLLVGAVLWEIGGVRMQRDEDVEDALQRVPVGGEIALLIRFQPQFVRCSRLRVIEEAPPLRRCEQSESVRFFDVPISPLIGEGCCITFALVAPDGWATQGRLASPLPAMIALPGGSGDCLSDWILDWRVEDRGWAAFVPLLPKGRSTAMWTSASADLIRNLVHRLLRDYSVEGGRFHLAARCTGGSAAMHWAVTCPGFFHSLVVLQGTFITQDLNLAYRLVGIPVAIYAADFKETARGNGRETYRALLTAGHYPDPVLYTVPDTVYEDLARSVSADHLFGVLEAARPKQPVDWWTKLQHLRRVREEWDARSAEDIAEYVSLWRKYFGTDMTMAPPTDPAHDAAYGPPGAAVQCTSCHGAGVVGDVPYEMCQLCGGAGRRSAASVQTP